MKKLVTCLFVFVFGLFLVSCSPNGYYPNMGSISEDILNSEEYLELQEKGYMSTDVNNKVNVSLDSSTAAYSNIRQRIKHRSYIEHDMVNIEQMLSYFNYSYVNDSEEQLKSFLELGNCPWNDESKLLSVAIKAKEYSLENQKPSNFVFLLDVSGSMNQENKLPLMVEAFKILIDNLNDDDRVSIVTYAGREQVILEGAYGYEKTKISAAISELSASGSTAGADGIRTAYKLANKYFIEGGNNRVFLATDGDFNVGISSTALLKTFIAAKRLTGVYLSLFGFGTGNLKANVMDTLASAGNGQYYYIDSILEAKKVFVSSLGGTLETVAKDCKAQVEFNKDVVAGYRLIGYENKELTDEEFEDSETDAGEIGAGHTTICLLEVIMRPGYEDYEGEIARCVLRYKDARDNEMNKEIINKVYSLTNNPSNDFIFASAVVEFGLVLRNSEYMGYATCENILDRIDNEIFKSDPYKEEFIELIKIYNEYQNDVIY